VFDRYERLQDERVTDKSVSARTFFVVQATPTLVLVLFLGLSG